MRQRFLVSALLAFLLGCGGQSEDSNQEETGNKPSAGPTWFREAATDSGIDFKHESGHQKRMLFPETTCGGAALVDVDNDGDLDAYLVQSGRLDLPADQRPGNRLFLNDGQGNFQDATDGSGADDRGYGMGVAAGDYDNDGDTDLYVTNLGANVLLRNDGSGRFENVTADAGVGVDSWSSSAAFVDYDADGDLDLFVVNYVHWSLQIEQECYNNRGKPTYCGPNYYVPLRDCLFRNEGDGKFKDVSEEAGLGERFGNGLGVVCGDFNGDGRIDIYVANDMVANQLWLNQGDGKFRDVAQLAGCALADTGVAKAGMGVTAEDMDDDQDLDLLVVNLHDESDSYFRNEGEFFVDRSSRLGLASTNRAFTRFGMGLVDFNNDGRFDFFVANGRINHDLPPIVKDPLAEPNLLFTGTEAGDFREVLPRGGTSSPQMAVSRAAAFGDVDNDGGVDVLVVNRDAQASLLKNVVPNRGNWIQLKVLDRNGRDALGATVTLKIGDRTIRRDVKSAFSYCAANDPRIHVGLGSQEQVDEVTVRWPTGQEQSFGMQQAGQVTLKEQVAE